MRPVILVQVYQPYLLTSRAINMYYATSKNLAAGSTEELDLAKQLSTSLVVHRKQAGITQAELASAVGVETETISRFERGRHVPSVATLKRIANALSTTVSNLLGETEPSKLMSEDQRMVMYWLGRLSELDRKFALEQFRQTSSFLSDRHGRMNSKR